MTPKPKTAIDPVFAAIAEHKVLTQKSGRLEKSYRDAVTKAEEKYGDRIEHVRRSGAHDWPGGAIVDPFYDRWNRADRDARRSALRFARTAPLTAAAAAAMITHARREIAVSSNMLEDWPVLALKTAAAALARQP